MTTPPLTIAVDVDEVCADLIAAWLARYNRDYDDNLLPENITRWEIEQCVKPECGKRIFEYLDHGHVYDDVLPIPGARTAVYELASMGHRVVFVSSCGPTTMDAKVQWLQRWGFLAPGHKVQNFIAAQDKSLIRADLLVDDAVHNVEDFQGHAYLVTRPHNLSAETRRTRIEGLHELPGILRRFW